VKIELLRAGALVGTMTSGTPIGTGGNGSFTWNISSARTPGSDYKVRVTSTTNSSYSDTSDNNFTISAPLPTPPAAATLISPTGTITTNTPTYTWNAVSKATSYCLWVTDSTRTPFQQWYTAAQANCESGTGTCTVTPTTPLANGNASWWIDTWNSAGSGPWSERMDFIVSVSVPSKATLVSPTGTITTSTPTYIWNAVSNATWYYLWVTDSSGAPFQQWYTAAQDNCASGTGTCSVTPTKILTVGNCSWWIDTWNSVGLGPWSDRMDFNRSQ